MNNWLCQSVSEHFSVIKTLKENESCKICLVSHNTQNMQAVFRVYKGSASSYIKLIGFEHENLPVIYDAFQDGDYAYILEEYLEGITYGEILCSHVISEKQASGAIISVCSAAEALHSVGVIHRDIKPENIMLLNNGGTKLFDFGASRIFDKSKGNDTVIIGTIGFAAPEQYGIVPSDSRTDIFSIGVTLNVMLTGFHPIKKIYTGGIGNIIRKCIETNPDMRYKSAAELKKALSKFL